MIQNIHPDKRSGSNAGRRFSYSVYRSGETDVNQVAGGSVIAVIAVLGRILADAVGRSGGATVRCTQRETLMAGSAALRVHQQIHGAGSAVGIGCGLRCLPVKPHVRKIKGETKAAQKKNSQDEHEKYGGLAGFTGPAVLSIEIPGMLGHRGHLLLVESSSQFMILPSAAALTVTVGQLRKNGR